MSKLIVVIGLTGQQGGSVANVFVNEPGWKVRGVTRSAAKAKEWVDKGVEVVEGNLDDKNSLVKAFKGAYAVFGTTDFWGPAFNPANKEKLAPGQTINEWVFEYEKRQQLNIAEAAAETAGLERYVCSALGNAKKATKGRLQHVYHFDCKAEAVEQIKATMPELAKKLSIVQMGCYMTNWGHGTNPQKQDDGSYTLTVVGKGETPIPLAWTTRDTGTVVKAVLQVPPGVNVSVAGSVLTWKQVLDIWCKSNNVPNGGYKEISTADMAKYAPFPPEIGLEFAEMFELMDNPGYNGGDPEVIFPQDLGVPCPMTTWEQYCQENPGPL